MNDHPSSPASATPKASPLGSPWEVLSFAWQLGYLIAIPVVTLGVGGAVLDERISTSPLFTLIGFLLAFVLSAVSITGRIKTVLKT